MEEYYLARHGLLPLTFLLPTLLFKTEQIRHPKNIAPELFKGLPFVGLQEKRGSTDFAPSPSADPRASP